MQYSPQIPERYPSCHLHPLLPSWSLHPYHTKWPERFRCWSCLLLPVPHWWSHRCIWRIPRCHRYRCWTRSIFPESHRRFPADRTDPVPDTPAQYRKSPVRYCKPASAVFLSRLRSVFPAPVPALLYYKRSRLWSHFLLPALPSVPVLPSAVPESPQ